MERILKIIVAILIASIAVSSILFYTNHSIYNALVQEDGIIEYLTALVLFLSSFFLFLRLIKVGRRKNAKWILANVLMVLGLFFAFGEEISWGQRLFSIESSNFFMENNLQKETNLHNLEFNGIKINKLIFANVLTIGFGIYFFFSLLMYRKLSGIKSIIDKFGIPIPSIKQSLILLILTIQIMITTHIRKWEVWECLFALVFLWILLDPFNSREKLFPSKALNKIQG